MVKGLSSRLGKLLEMVQVEVGEKAGPYPRTKDALHALVCALDLEFLLGNVSDKDRDQIESA